VSFPNCISVTLLSSGEVDEEENEREHSSMEDQLDKELQELDKRLQQKEVLVPCLYYYDLFVC
jgi:Spy/CpxP family protein refolding chaperone